MSPSPHSLPPARTVNLVTLGCARNEVDSEELAARLTASGWELTSDDDASVVLVNTCGFIQAAKQESIDELFAAAESGAKVAAVGCLAERYGAELAGELPEAQVLSFDDYGEIGARLDDVLAGRKRPAHVARDRRTLLPISPAERQSASPRPAAGTPLASIAQPSTSVDAMPASELGIRMVYSLKKKGPVVSATPADGEGATVVCYILPIDNRGTAKAEFPP